MDDRKLLYGYGDSNMWGWDPRLGAVSNRLPDREVWINMVANCTGCRFINNSLPGRRIPIGSAVPLFLSSVEAESWDILFLMLGVNDLLSMPCPAPGRIAELWIPALEALTSECPDRKNRIVLASITPCRMYVSSQERKMISEGYARVAERFGICFFDTLSLALSLQFDGIHLNADGHKALAEAVSRYLQRFI